MLYNEAVDTGKGGQWHYHSSTPFFANHSFGEQHVFLLPDNCVGQNMNNNAMLAVLDMPNLSPNLNIEVAKILQ